MDYHHNFKISLIMLLLFGFSFFYIIHYGFYPVALVNGEMVLAGDYYKMVNSGYIYYANSLVTYQKLKPSLAEKNKLYDDIAKASLDKLIEQKLINKEFVLRNGLNAQDLVDKKLIGIENDSLKDPVAKLYGLTMPDFRKVILEPEAKRELLVEYFKSRNEDFNQWLDNAKTNMSLRILVPMIK